MVILVAKVLDASFVRLTWDVQEGVTSYKLLRGTTPTPATLIATLSAGVQFFNDHGDDITPTPGLSPATAYYYQLTDQDDTPISAVISAQTAATATKSGLVRVVQDALETWAAAGSGLGDAKMTWRDQNGPKLLKPFVELALTGPMPGGLTQSKEQDGMALGDLEVYTVQVNVMCDPPGTDANSPDAFQLAADLRKSLEDPSLREALNVAGIGVGIVQGVQDLSELLDTKFEQRALLEFSINVGTSFPISIPYTIDTVTPPVGTVGN